MAAARSTGVPIRPVLVALQFLTRVPLRIEPPADAREIGLSLACYPVVGLLLGMVLWAAALAVSGLPAVLGAAIVLAIWVLATGALHLDGLADLADAWVGGHGDRRRTLRIMQDPRSGPVALAAVNCLLLLKFAGLAALVMRLHAAPRQVLTLAAGCILPPLLARAAIPLLFAHTPYVRSHGIGRELAANQCRTAGVIMAAVAACGTVVACGTVGAAALAVTAASYGLVRRGLIRRLGGFTGDGAGALIEVIEAACLVAVAATSS
jgi:adenosylcobinamide-GDP ribazoletransferase